MSLYESCDFSEGVIEVAKIEFSLEGVYGPIFLTEFGGKLFASFFPSLFFFSQGENPPPKKNPAETQSMKIQVKSGEILVCKNVGKIMQNIGSRRLTSKSTKLTC